MKTRIQIKLQEVLGFTLMEIMVVIIILGIVMAFAVPNYQKAVETTHLDDALSQMKAIHAAQQVYQVKNGSYFPTTNITVALAAINTNLNLHINENGMTYTCTGSPYGGGTQYSCTAVRQAPAPTFTVTLTQTDISETNPVCSGSCP